MFWGGCPRPPPEARTSDARCRLDILPLCLRNFNGLLYHSNINYLVPVLEEGIPLMKNPGCGPGFNDV